MKTLTFLFLILASSISVHAQSNRAIERELVGHMKNIERFSRGGTEQDYDRQDKEERALKRKLLRYSRRPSILNYDFPELGRLMKILTSDDRRLRLYSWDSPSGGTMSFTETVLQYQGSDGVLRASSEEIGGESGGMGRWPLEIRSLMTKTGPVYVVITTARASNIMEWQYVNLYKIIGAKFVNAKLFKTQSGLSSEIKFSYDNQSFKNNQFNQVIKFDRKSNTITFPVVIVESGWGEGRITDDLITYKFNGTHFVKVK
jgi:hypothetical protein